MGNMDAPPSASSDDPTPEEIAQRAAAIRATWSERIEHERRVWHGRREWVLPCIPWEDCEPVSHASE